MEENAQGKNKSGCLKYAIIGCLTIVALFVIGGVVLYFSTEKLQRNGLAA